MGINLYQEHNNPLTHSSLKKIVKNMSLDYYTLIIIPNYKYHITNGKWAHHNLLNKRALNTS